MKSEIIWIVIFVLVIAAAYFGLKYIDAGQTQGCPEDLKICPDGTTVVRVPPACEFSPCPQSQDAMDRIEDAIREKLGDN